MKYKNNHIIPSSLLRQWATYEQGRYGVFQYDLQKKRINFASARKRGAFSFAAIADFYVPTVRNQRRTEIELWLGKLESQLRPVIDKMRAGTEGILVPTREDATQLLQAIFSLRHRTDAAVNANRAYFNNRPGSKRQISPMEERDTDLLVLENMVNAIRHDALEFGNCRFHVFTSPAGNFIIGDQPFLGDILQANIHFVVLSPFFVIAIEKIAEGVFFSYTEFPKQFLEEFNEHIARHARRWIVSNDRSALERYIPFADAPKQDNTPILEPRKHFFSAFRFN